MVELEPLALQAAQRLVLVLGTCLARVHEQLDDGVLARPGQPRDGADRHALEPSSRGFARVYLTGAYSLSLPTDKLRIDNGMPYALQRVNIRFAIYVDKVDNS